MTTRACATKVRVSSMFAFARHVIFAFVSVSALVCFHSHTLTLSVSSTSTSTPLLQPLFINLNFSLSTSLPQPLCIKVSASTTAQQSLSVKLYSAGSVRQAFCSSRSVRQPPFVNFSPSTSLQHLSLTTSLQPSVKLYCPTPVFL